MNPQPVSTFVEDTQLTDSYIDSLLAKFPTHTDMTAQAKVTPEFENMGFQRAIKNPIGTLIFFPDLPSVRRYLVMEYLIRTTTIQ